MFEQHFALKSNPFDGQAAGAGVFVGPQTATLVNRAKRVFAGPESVVCLSGPVGSGKSTLAARALAAVGRPHTIIRIGRIRLGPDEVLDFLLRELGLRQMPAGTIQKMTVFRSVLKKLEDQDVRLFIVVEDAERLGQVALQELEALTATDSGVSNGANLFLMAEEPLKSMLESPSLKRLRQRARLHYTVQPMTAPEVRGYLAHRFRQAGSDLAKIVSDDAVVAVHSLAEGIPRVINNLMNSALEAAAEKGLQKLDAAELGRVAAEEYGLELDAALINTLPAEPDPEHEHEQPVPPAAGTNDRPKASKEPGPAAEAASSPTDRQASVADDDFEIPDLIQDTSPGMASPKAAAKPVSEPVAELIPDLIQDTSPGMPSPEPAANNVNAPLPDLDTLAPGLATASARPDRDDESATDADGDLDEALAALAAGTMFGDEDSSDDDIPTLFASSAGMETPKHADSPVGEGDKPSADEVPAWDRDPTLAELRPDLDALERAMAFAHGGDNTDDDDSEPVAERHEPASPEQPEAMPEITLDDSIRRKVDIPGVDLLEVDVPDTERADARAEAAAPSETLSIVEDFDRKPAKADLSLDRIAAELARAKSLEEVDDKLAETLFGEEFSLMAAQVAANSADLAPEPGPADEAPAPAELALEPEEEDSEADAAADDGDLERAFRDLYGDSAVEVSMETTPTGLPVAKTETRSKSASNSSGASRKPAPEPIEDQINTSITQTLKAFDPAKFADTHTEERSGFFSRFRRS